MTEDEMVGWHHQLNRHEFEQALGVGDGQGSLVCCNPWGKVVQDLVTQQQTHSEGKESAYNAGVTGNLGSIPGLGRCPRVGNGNPLQYSSLENPMDRGIWKVTVQCVAESQTQ